MSTVSPPISADELTPRALSSRGWLVLLCGTSVAVALPVFVRLTSAMASSDIMNHAQLAKKIVEGGQWLSYSLWYPIIYLASIGTGSYTFTRLASIGLLTLLVVAKSLTIFFVARHVLKSPQAAFVVAAGVLVAMPLLDPARPTAIYLGQIAPTVWHNSTNILAAPLAVIAFAMALKAFRLPSIRAAALLGLALVGSVAAKPNLALAFLPVAGVILLIVVIRSAQGLWRGIAMIAVAFVPPTLLLAYQYLVVFESAGITETSPGIRPFAVWSEFSPNIPLSILISLAGPLVVLLAMSPTRRRSLPVLGSWVTLAIAIIQLAMLAEMRPDGTIALSGNWFWGAYTACMIVFVVSLIELVRIWRERPASVASIMIAACATLFMFLHVATGLYYVLNIGVGDYPSY